MKTTPLELCPASHPDKTRLSVMICNSAVHGGDWRSGGCGRGGDGGGGGGTALGAMLQMVQA